MCVVCSAIKCEELVAPANMVLMLTNSNLVNSTARYGCVNSSFNLVGPDTRVCTDMGIWTGLPPTCIGEHAQVATGGEHAQWNTSGENSQLIVSGEHARLVENGGHAQLVASGEHAQLVESGGHAQLIVSGEHAQLNKSGEHARLVFAPVLGKYGS